MQSLNLTRFYSLRADANALGGHLEEPFRKVLPTLAPVSLPSVGGFATARSEAFTFEEIVSFSSAYTRVSGLEERDGSVSITATSVVEELNLLEVVKAERVVAQVSISVPRDGGPLQFSTAGSAFDGLKVVGCHKEPVWNERLQHLVCDDVGHPVGFAMADAAEQGAAQAARVIEFFKNSQHDSKWAEKRFGWMSATQARNGHLCSVLDGFGTDRKNCHGHVVDIPGFGRFMFGELLVSADSVQLVSIRAELGCPVKGKINTNCAGGGGLGDN